MGRTRKIPGRVDMKDNGSDTPGKPIRSITRKTDTIRLDAPSSPLVTKRLTFADTDTVSFASDRSRIERQQSKACKKMYYSDIKEDEGSDYFSDLSIIQTEVNKSARMSNAGYEAANQEDSLRGSKRTRIRTASLPTFMPTLYESDQDVAKNDEEEYKIEDEDEKEVEEEETPIYKLNWSLLIYKEFFQLMTSLSPKELPLNIARNEKNGLSKTPSSSHKLSL